MKIKEKVKVTYCKWRCQLCPGARELGPRICPALSAFQPHPEYSKIQSKVGSIMLWYILIRYDKVGCVYLCYSLNSCVVLCCVVECDVVCSCNFC